MTRGQFAIAVCRACLRREGLAFLAFVVASGAGVVFTALLVWQVFYLQSHERSDDIAHLAFGLLLLLGILQLSLHRLLGSKLAIEAEVGAIKAKLSQGGEQ